MPLPWNEFRFDFAPVALSARPIVPSLYSRPRVGPVDEFVVDRDAPAAGSFPLIHSASMPAGVPLMSARPITPSLRFPSPSLVQ